MLYDVEQGNADSPNPEGETQQDAKETPSRPASRRNLHHDNESGGVRHTSSSQDRTRKQHLNPTEVPEIWTTLDYAITTASIVLALNIVWLLYMILFSYSYPRWFGKHHPGLVEYFKNLPVVLVMSIPFVVLGVFIVRPEHVDSQGRMVSMSRTSEPRPRRWTLWAMAWLLSVSVGAAMLSTRADASLRC